MSQDNTILNGNMTDANSGYNENIIVSESTGGYVSSSRDFEKIKKDLEGLAQTTETVQKDLATVTKDKEQLKKEVQETKDESKNLKQKIIEGLGLFVAFITFVSANVTVFSKIENISIAVFFMELMLLCMLIFVYAFCLIIESKNTKMHERVRSLIYWVIGGVIVSYIGMWFLEKNLVTITRLIGDSTRVCINCTIDKELNFTQPRLLLKSK